MLYIIVTEYDKGITSIDIVKADSIEQAKVLVGGRAGVVSFVTMTTDELDALLKVSRGVVSKLV